LDGAGEGAIHRLTDDRERVSQPAWSPDGRLAAYVRRREGKYREIWALNVAEALQRPTETEPVRLVSNFRTLDIEPDWSPDGQQLAYASSLGSYADPGDGDAVALAVHVMRVDGSEQTCLTAAGWPPSQPATGAAGVHDSDLFWNTAPAWSPLGDRLAFQSNRDGNNEIYLMSSSGASQQNLTRHPASDGSPAWSPDGTQIAFVSDRDGNEEIYVMDVAGTNVQRLTHDPGADKSPAWSPDGHWIAFHADRYSQVGANFDLHLVRADGSRVLRLTTHADFDGFPAWQPAAPPGLSVELPSESLPPDGGRSVPSEVAAWLQSSLIALDSVKPAPVLPVSSVGLGDLAPLADLVGEAQIVDLGASAFGYHEALSVRHRIVQYLVTELGFSTLVFDVSRADALLLNDYIRTGSGDAAQILAALDDPRWNNEEIRYLIEWMRVHNQEPRDAPVISLCSVEPDDPPAATDLIVASLLARDLNKPADTTIQSYYEYLSDRRERGLENARLCAEQAGPEAKYVLWTYHFRALATYVDNDYVRPFSRHPLAAEAIGEYLDQEPFVIGFRFGDGWLTAYDSLEQTRTLQEWLLPAPPPDSFEWIARRSGVLVFLLPLDDVWRDDPATSWLEQPLLTRQIIGVYDATQPEEHYAPVRFSRAFDAIVYIDRATPVQHRWGR
jgi:erythromycin esterase-like protein